MALSVELARVSKRFGNQWVLRELDYAFQTGTIYGIRGRNGSGKSTLLRLLSGQLSPSRGTLVHRTDQRVIPPDEIYRYVSWTGPYLEVVEELSLRELLTFHFRLKPLAKEMSVEQVLDRTGLAAYAQLPLRDCSSGMRQRILLAMTLYTAAPLVLLDEPTLTLDERATDWFAGELRGRATDRLVVVASNDDRDLRLCDRILDLNRH